MTDALQCRAIGRILTNASQVEHRHAAFPEQERVTPMVVSIRPRENLPLPGFGEVTPKRRGVQQAYASGRTQICVPYEFASVRVAYARERQELAVGENR